MKFWLGIFTFISAVVFVGMSSSNTLGDKIAVSVEKLRQHDWSEDRVAFAKSSLEQMQTEMARVKAQTELLEKEARQQEHTRALSGVASIIDAIPNGVERCDKARALLRRRLASAQESDSLARVHEARQWSDYVRKTYCLAMPVASSVIR